MRSSRNLEIFLDAGCNYTQGARTTSRTMAQFRDAVQDELLHLESEMGTSIPSLRATYLRSQQTPLRILAEQYKLQQSPGTETTEVGSSIRT